MRELVLLKIGGKVLDQPEDLSKLLHSFANLNCHKLLVHGGGKKVDELLDKLGIQPRYINGRRVTDAQTLPVVTMALAGLVNTQLVAQLQQYGANAIGLTGADANMIQAQKRPIGQHDYGFAGDVERISITSLNCFLQQEMTPVFCPITHNNNGQLLNTNADTIARQLAIELVQSSLWQVKLCYCFELKGVYQDLANEDSLIKTMNESLYKDYQQQGILKAGMIPKLDNCFNGLKAGIDEIKLSNVQQIINFFEHKDYQGTTIKLY